MEDENNQFDTVPVPTEGEDNVDGTTLTLDQLNEQLGTKYQSVEKAIEGLKNTKSYVGKAGVIEKENATLREALGNKSGDYITKEQYEQDMFYSKNADLEPYKDIINARAKELGLRPSEAIEKDVSLKGTLEKIRGFDKVENAKSVLMTNSRLGQVTDELSKAQEAQAKGDHTKAGDFAVKAVLEGIM